MPRPTTSRQLKLWAMQQQLQRFSQAVRLTVGTRTENERAGFRLQLAVQKQIHVSGTRLRRRDSLVSPPRCRVIRLKTRVGIAPDNVIAPVAALEHRRAVEPGPPAVPAFDVRRIEQIL